MSINNPKIKKQTLAAIFIWLLCLLTSIWLVIKTPINNDLISFLPQTDAPSKSLLINQLQEGMATRLLLIALEGQSTTAIKASLSKRFAQELRNQGLRVFNGERVDNHQNLFAYRYLLSHQISAERFSAESLSRILQQRLYELSSPISVFEKHLLPSDPTGEFLAILQAWQGMSQNQPEKRYGVWFSSDGKRALLLVDTIAPAFELDAQESAIKLINNTFMRVNTDDDADLLLSGPGVFAVASRETIRSETQMLSIAASVIVALIILLTYRSLRLLLLSALPLLTGILVAVATVSLLFGQIYGITLAFGITLLGIAIDYPIHVFSHFQSQARIWATLGLSVITTAMGYIAMISTDFSGLMQLGVFAIAGLLSAAAFTRWVLPNFLPQTWYLPDTKWLTALLFPPRALVVLFSALGFIALIALFTITPVSWENDLAALTPIPAPERALDKTLRAELGAPEISQLVVITAPDAETALQRSELMQEEFKVLINKGFLKAYDMAAHYLPSIQTQQLRQAALPERAQLVTALNQALQTLPFKLGLFEPFLQAVEKARTMPPLHPDDLKGTDLGLRVSSLLFQTGNSWVAIVPLMGITADVSGWFEEHNYNNIYYLNLKTETNRLMVDFREEALERVAWGVLLIILVLWFGLKSLRRVVIVLLPVALSIIVDVVILSSLGTQITLFHLISLLLVLGIGIDYSLFFNRPDREIAMRQRTLHALLVCAISTIVVFGLLALSEIPVLKAIGETVGIGVFVSFLMAWALAQ